MSASSPTVRLGMSGSSIVAVSEVSTLDRNAKIALVEDDANDDDDDDDDEDAPLPPPAAAR